MANYQDLKDAIKDVIKTNGNQEITGQVLQSVLLSIINTIGINYAYAGIATPITNPGMPDQNVFYIATKKGTYPNFSGLTIKDGDIAILKNTNNSWSVEYVGLSGIRKVALSDLDSIKEIDCTGYYLVEKGDGSYIGTLIAAEDIQLKIVSQLLISDIIPTDSNFGGQREPGMLHILTRSYNPVQLQWTKWNYYGVYDNVATDRTWWSSKKINEELLKRYKSIGFAGIVSDTIMPSSTPGEGTEATVYFSTHLKRFCLKKNASYFSRWDNSFLWNDKADTDSPVAYSDCYYINYGKQYVFDGTGLKVIGGGSNAWMLNTIFAGGSDVSVLGDSSVVSINYTKKPEDYNKKLYLAYCGKRPSSTSDNSTYVIQIKDEDGSIVAQFFKNLPTQVYGVQDYELTEYQNSGLAFIVRANLDEVTATINFTKKLEILLHPYYFNSMERIESLEAAVNLQDEELKEINANINGSYPKLEVSSNSTKALACKVKAPSDDVYIINVTCSDDIFIEYDLFYASEDLKTLEAFKLSAVFGQDYEVPKHATLEYLYIFNNRQNSEEKPTAYVNFSPKNSIRNLIKNPLEGKKIVVFGDSITENKDANGKRWTDYFADKTGAIVYNAGIGGTQMNMRQHLLKFKVTSQATSEGSITVKIGRTLTADNILTTDTPEQIVQKIYDNIREGSYLKQVVKVFGDTLYSIVGEAPDLWNDASTCTVETATGIKYEFSQNYWCGVPERVKEVAGTSYGYGALDIPSMVCGFVNNDWTNQKEAAEYIRDAQRDDNTEIVNNISNVRISDVDAVILFGGTNNYADTGFGEPGKAPTNSVSWHLEKCIEQLLSANPKLHIYILTPICRYFGKNISNWDDSLWCDNHIYGDNGFAAMPKLVEAENAVAKYWHIPIFDLYYSLGWNKWNYSEYFNNTDGTHPKKGYEYLGYKIASLISSNNSF